MIKNFEEYINEDYFSKLASRKDNGDRRKEDENIVWVDLGLPSGTLWASELLCDNDGEYAVAANPHDFLHDDAKRIVDEYHVYLPTKKQIKELFDNVTYKITSETTAVLTSKINKKKITLDRGKVNHMVFVLWSDEPDRTFSRKKEVYLCYTLRRTYENKIQYGLFDYDAYYALNVLPVKTNKVKFPRNNQTTDEDEELTLMY